MQTRIAKGRNSRIRTWRSRTNSPAKARAYCIPVELSVPRGIRVGVGSSSASSVIESRLCSSLLAKVSSGKPDEDRFEAGFGDRQVAQTVRIRLTNNIGEQ